MTDAQLQKLIKEIKEAHKKEIANIFGELSQLCIACPHLFGKTTYKVEMTFLEWRAFDKRYSGEKC